MTVPEFFRWVENREARFELVRGVPVAMAPERARHNLVKSNLLIALRNAWASSGCTVFGDGMTVVIDEQTAYEPDAVVRCAQPLDLDATVVGHPELVVEVLSPSSKSVDSGAKLADYLSLPSVRHYLLADPTRKLVVHHRRGDADNVSTTIVRTGALELDEGRVIEVDEIFAGV
ncbi:MAG: Uma2 family endonuclease [Myxococcota bacterium]